MRLRPLLMATLAVALSAQDADAIIARDLQARGGAARLSAVKTLRMAGQAALIPDIKRFPWREEDRFPHAWRKELTLDAGLTEVDTFDGKEGWQLIGWASRVPKPLKPEATQYLQEEERYWDLLLTYKERGLQAKYLGKSLLDTEPVLLVRIGLSSSCEMTYYFDADNYLERRREQVWRSMGDEVTMQATFDDYRAVNGVLFPFYIERRALGRGARERVFLERVELNPTLPDARFGKPSL